MRKIISIYLFFIILSACSLEHKDSIQTVDYTKYVDPYIGTDYHGHVFLGANVPFGAVQTGPTNYIKGWDWCSGYHYSDSIVTGFSQLHLSGTGVGDLGDILVTPYTGSLKINPGTDKDPLEGYASKYSHKDEIAKAGYYAVTMKKYDIHVELTASERVAFHKYTFPADENSHIVINLERGIGWDRPVETYFKQLDDTTYIGYRFSTGWAKDQRLYFAIRISKPVAEVKLFDADKHIQDNEARGKNVIGNLNFSTRKNEIIMLKIGISPISEGNALDNIIKEIPDWDFEQTVANANKAWNKELSKIKVKSNNEKYLRTFYTSLYHAFIAPILFNDNNGAYRGTDKKVYQNPGFQNYSVFSLWDTYRAAHPFFTLIQRERVSDMMNSMLAIYRQQGKLPIWHLVGNETDCMVGYSSVPVLADAYFKDFTGFDYELMFEAMKTSSMRDDYGVNYLKEMEYIPADLEKESVSKALEYAISDWCIAQVAQKNGNIEDYEYYLKRSEAYKHYFDQNTKFMRPKLKNGEFRYPFDPFKSNHEWGDYTEGNAWQYTWLVPQDVEGLVHLFGSEEAFVSKLDSLFTISGDQGKNAPPDISGLIGQYAHGNEPSHHIAYLYAYAGKQWKTAEKVRFIMNNLYNDRPNGLCGNEDCGQMSAWYLLSALGFYQVNPANSAFVFGSPLFDEVILKLPDERNFIIKTLNNSAQNIYIQSVKLDGKPYTRSFITYNEIMDGGLLEFEMGNTPNKEFGTKNKDRPKSRIYE